jgi:hypothetical protein
MKARNGRDREQKDVHVSGEIESCLRPAQALSDYVLEGGLKDEDEHPCSVHGGYYEYPEVYPIANETVGLEEA